jgi:hypothetical protein
MHVEEDESVSLTRWRLVQAVPPESCRWVCRDGRWVSLTLAHVDHMTHVAVADSSGRRELVDSYEGALLLARAWRT